MYSLILLTLLIVFYIFIMYRMFTAYKLFKGSNFKLINSKTSIQKNNISRLYLKYIFISILFIFDLLYILISGYQYYQAWILWLIIYISTFFNNTLFINNYYISNLFYTVSIKDLDYIIIEETSYTTVKLVFHTKNNKKLRPMSFSNKNIDYIKESLREYGVEVHVSNK